MSGLAVVGEELRIDGVVKRFRGVAALDGLSCVVDARRTTGIIGPNGSGKTTLFNVITGFMRPDEGSVSWLGRRITGRSPHTIARLGLARSFQQRMVFPGFTVYENVETAANGAGIKGRRRRIEVEQALELLGLADYAKEPTGELSFGTTRLVGIACLVPLHPKLVLLDEPAAGLSGREAVELSEGLRGMRDAGIGLCIVDHSMEFMTDLCEHLIMMDAGRLVTEGAPRDVINHPEVAAAYLGRSHAN
jgi:ABC-type branched-subunit amino acid transport system ATPase component